jgi:hypothetical protein
LNTTVLNSRLLSTRSCSPIAQAMNTRLYSLIFHRYETRGFPLDSDFQILLFSSSSKSDWAPDHTSSLWGKVPRHGNHDHHQNQGQYQQQQHQQTSYDYGKQEQGNTIPIPFGSAHPTSLLGSQQSDSQEKKHWYGNITEGQKHALEVDSTF